MMMHLSPPNGSLIARPIGALNSARFECDVFAEHPSGETVQIGTTWSLQAFGSDREVLVFRAMFKGVFQIEGTARPTDSPLANYTFMNRLTVVNFTEQLDKMVLNCLGPNSTKVGSFILRAYSKFEILRHNNKLSSNNCV